MSETKKRPYKPNSHDAGIYIASNKLDDDSETYDMVLSSADQTLNPGGGKR